MRGRSFPPTRSITMETVPVDSSTPYWTWMVKGQQVDEGGACGAGLVMAFHVWLEVREECMGKAAAAAAITCDQMPLTGTMCDFSPGVPCHCD